jgi:hypothetical protein
VTNVRRVACVHVVRAHVERAMLTGHAIVGVDNISDSVRPVCHVKVRCLEYCMHLRFENTDKMFNLSVEVLVTWSTELLGSRLAKTVFGECFRFEDRVGVRSEFGRELHGDLVAFAVGGKVCGVEILAIGMQSTDNFVG